jgi:hypothetical protein
LIYKHKNIRVLENEHVCINKELHLNLVTFERRQKAYDEKRKQQQIKIERMIKEIDSQNTNVLKDLSTFPPPPTPIINFIPQLLIKPSLR